MSVYVAQVGAHIKVGYSDNPVRRVKNMMQGAVARPVMLDRKAERVLIGTFDGASLDDERLLHESLADHHCMREWFFADADLIDKIRAFECEGPKRFRPTWTERAELIPAPRTPEPVHEVSLAALDSASEILRTGVGFPADLWRAS